MKLKIIEIVKNQALDLIFPKFCVGCNLEGEWVCPKCAKEVVKVVTQVCPDCQRISPFGRYCPRCRKKHRLGGILVSDYYEEGPIKEAIHNLKYNNVTELAEFLAKDIVDCFKQNNQWKRGDLIFTAVPLHFLKKSQRGYNQAELLAEIVANKENFEKNFKILRKIKWTKSQVKKSGQKRRENLKNAFKNIDASAVKNRIIILVDDVTTTGTTLEECARVLREAGAKKVWGLVAARG